MEETKPSGRGGRRAGAGRKSKGGVHYYGFNAPQEVHEILQQVEGSKAEFICLCILKAVGKDR